MNAFPRLPFLHVPDSTVTRKCKWALKYEQRRRPDAPPIAGIVDRAYTASRAPRLAEIPAASLAVHCRRYPPLVRRVLLRGLEFQRLDATRPSAKCSGFAQRDRHQVRLARQLDLGVGVLARKRDFGKPVVVADRFSAGRLADRP